MRDDVTDANDANDHDDDQGDDDDGPDASVFGEHDDDGPDASVFGEHADYVTKLRGEAAERRRKAKEAETARDAANERLRATQARLVELECNAAAAGILADPSDLLAYVPAADLLDDDGNPDPVKMKAAAVELVERKAHLAPRVTVGGDVDQGARDTGPAPFDFAGLLRQAAG